MTVSYILWLSLTLSSTYTQSKKERLKAFALNYVHQSVFVGKKKKNVVPLFKSFRVVQNKSENKKTQVLFLSFFLNFFGKSCIGNMFGHLDIFIEEII